MGMVGMAKVYARLIYKGLRTLNDVPEKVGKKEVRQAYLELFGEEL